MWKTRLLVLKGLVYVSNLAVEALEITLSLRELNPNEEYNDSYYTSFTYENLASAIPWITESLQTINENTASGIDQSTDFVSDQIGKGTEYVAGLIGTPQNSRRLVESGINPNDTLHARLDDIEGSLHSMSNEIKDIGEKICSGKPNRGKASKKSKKKKNNLFDQAKVVDEESDGPGRDRLLRTSLGRQIEEAKTEPQNEKIGRLENKLDTVAASQNAQNEKMDILELKMDNLERKVDTLSSLMMQLLDATQQE